jgi:hypothetical protein
VPPHFAAKAASLQPDDGGRPGGSADVTPLLRHQPPEYRRPRHGAPLPWPAGNEAIRGGCTRHAPCTTSRSAARDICPATNTAAWGALADESPVPVRPKRSTGIAPSMQTEPRPHLWHVSPRACRVRRSAQGRRPFRTSSFVSRPKQLSVRSAHPLPSAPRRYRNARRAATLARRRASAVRRREQCVGPCRLPMPPDHGTRCSGSSRKEPRWERGSLPFGVVGFFPPVRKRTPSPGRRGWSPRTG